MFCATFLLDQICVLEFRLTIFLKLEQVASKKLVIYDDFKQNP